MSFNSVVLLSFKFPGPCFLRSTGHIIFFSWTIMSKDKSCNEVNPMWSTNLWDKHVPYSFRKESGFFNVPCKPYSTEGAGDSSEPWIYSLCSRRLQCLIIFQLIILSYFKSLRIGPYCERLITITLCCRMLCRWTFILEKMKMFLVWMWGNSILLFLS